MAIGRSEQLYTEVWMYYKPVIVQLIGLGNMQMYPLDKKRFEAVGNRESYSFRIQYINGRCPKCPNSAVARDLNEVLGSSPKFKEVCNNKNVVIRLSSKFELITEVSLISDEAE